MTQRQRSRTCSLPRAPTELACRGHASDLRTHTAIVDNRIAIDRKFGLAMSQEQVFVFDSR